MHIKTDLDTATAFLDAYPKGPVCMLNLLYFREVADYRMAPELAPSAPISGEQAYQQYLEHTIPFLHQLGSTIIFYGTAHTFLIGPGDVVWDQVLLVEYHSVQDFLSLARNEGYLAGAGHRTAALRDSRLLPTMKHSRGIPTTHL